MPGSRLSRLIVVITAIAFPLLRPMVATAAEAMPTVLWNVAFSTGAYNDAFAVATGPDGHPVVAGMSCPLDFSDCNFRIIKYDASTGGILWTVTFDSGSGNADFVRGVAVGADGHPVVAGSSCNAGFLACVIRVIKYDGTTGGVLWNVTHNGPAATDEGKAVAVGPDGHPIVTAVGCDAAFASCAFRTLKVNGTTGAILWNVTFSSTSGRDVPFGIAIDSAGHAAVAGHSCQTDATGCNIRTLKYDGANGNVLWNAVFDSGLDVGIGSEAGVGVSTGADGHPVVAGFSCFSATECDFRTIKYDGANGNTLWNVTFNSIGQDYHVANAASVGADGHPVVTGYVCASPEANCDFLTMKLDGATGATVWMTTFVGPDNDQAFGVSTGNDGNPVVTGFSCDASFSVCDIRTIKYLIQQATPAGLDVVVELNGGTDTPRGVSVTYDVVAVPGNTTAVSSPSGPAPPDGFAFIGVPPIYFDLGTTAIAVGSIEVCFNYDGLSFAGPEADLKLLHFENGIWEDRTTSLNTTTNVICGTVSSLSPFAIAEPAKVLSSLGPASVWIGLKNSDDIGIRFDVRAEIYRNGTELVGSGQVDGVQGGSSGFNNARLNTIPLTSTGQVAFPSGTTLSIKLLVRNACAGSGKNSGAARLWYNDAAANSRFEATIDDPATYYLRDGFVLGTSPGAGPKKTIDVAAGAKCSAFKSFGTWSIVIP